MKTLEYFHDLAEPTIAEFENEPDNVRRAYLACIAAFHFADAAAAHLTGGDVKKMQPVAIAVADKLARLAPAYGLVRAVANMAKHIVLDPGRNKGRPLLRIEDTHVGPEAAFTDGAFLSDGTSLSDSKPVVRTRDGQGSLVDVAWCVTEARRAIEGYLQRPDMQ